VKTNEACAPPGIHDDQPFAITFALDADALHSAIDELDALCAFLTSTRVKL
jgi:hypothetical protein